MDSNFFRPKMIVPKTEDQVLLYTRHIIFKQAKLSWGSVQAKTVRLQRKIDPGLMDIHLKFTEFCSRSWSRIFGQKCWSKMYIGPKYVLGQKILVPTFLGSNLKKNGSKRLRWKMCKNILVHKTVVSKIHSNEIFWSKDFLV